jgi:hypothetical protein
MELNFDELKLRGVHEKHAVTTGNLGATSAVAYSRRKPRKSMLKNVIALFHSAYVIENTQRYY